MQPSETTNGFDQSIRWAKSKYGWSLQLAFTAWLIISGYVGVHHEMADRGVYAKLPAEFENIWGVLLLATVGAALVGASVFLLFVALRLGCILLTQR